MIKIETHDQIPNVEHVVVPTIFPDGTSQVWKLPEVFLKSNYVQITWWFENEVELFHLCSLRKLLKPHYIHLHIPYLPYARQDKEVDNSATFNLETFGDILNTFNFHMITSVDVHNPIYTGKLIPNFHNMEVTKLHNELIQELKPDEVVFPDQGAVYRYTSVTKGGFGNTYTYHNPFFSFDKIRDQQTGQIIKHFIPEYLHNKLNNKNVLIIDDLCDGGATFISMASQLKEQGIKNINLFVTHGVFSKGKKILYDAGISNIYTTNSLLKNTDGFKV